MPTQRYVLRVACASCSYVDPGSEAMSKLKTVGIPTTLLVDREGRELWRKTGPAEWDSPKFLESLRRHMRGAAS